MLLSLNSFEKVRDFVNAVTECDTDVNLISGNYVVNAKSIMGIFSLDLSKPIQLNIHMEDEDTEILEALKPYLVTE